MNLEKVKAYRLVEQHYSEDLKSEAYLLEHIRSGARVAVLENDDDNKVFYIGFRTPPTDSTGVAHILEHSVLCGSEAFPLKDPFVELAKGSLNTFLNAMTYPDKTVYPIASCNDQDYKNLMHVYLDAVFHPNIYKEEKIFRQEGWHYELENADAPLIINGVVYNEMKGAFSSPDDVLGREIMNSLFPDTSYGVESGGNPESIPDLSYEAFLDFHSRYYHPSNSYIYLYGNADMEERLNWMDEQYLSAYERITVESHPGHQESFSEPRKIRRDYPITEEESEEKNSYLSYNVMLGDASDLDRMQAFQLIDYAIISAEGAPLWKALTDAGIGTQVDGGLMDGIYQPYYSITVKNADPADEDRFVQIIEDMLQKFVTEGLDENALLACLNSMEFRYREADSGHHPKGLIYGLKAFDSWLYDDAKAFEAVECCARFARLREKIGTSYYTDLIRDYMINNNHKTVLTLVPKKGLTAEKDGALAEKLAALKASKDAAGIEELIRKTQELKKYQETPDAPEVIAMLPRISLADIRREARPFINEWTEIDGVKTLWHNIETNGIVYLNFLFDAAALPIRLYPYAGLLNLLLEAVDTENYDYEQLGYEIDKYIGHFSESLGCYYRKADNRQYHYYESVQIGVLKDSLKKCFELLEEILLHPDFSDKQRLREIIAENRSRQQGFMMSAGHQVALYRAFSYLSASDAIKERYSGYDFYCFIDDIEKHFEERIDSVVEGVKEVARILFRKNNVMLDITGTEAELKAVSGYVGSFTEKLVPYEVKEEVGSVEFEKKNEAFTNSAQIQYVCRAGNFKDHGLAYHGSLMVLKTILSYCYLWEEVRVKGGAYGCMNGFDPTGNSYFVSYRDPNLENTLKVYNKISEFLRNYDADTKEMEKNIIGTVSNMDMPLSPRAKGARSLSAVMQELEYEEIQRIRDEVLHASTEDIRKLADYVDAVLADDVICVVGNEEKIKESAAQFKTIRSMNS